MGEETKAELWEGRVSAKVLDTKAQNVWSLLVQDFCSIHKWLPSVDECYKVEGVHGQPGLIRYCGTTRTSSSNGSNEPITLWCHEKLLEIDEIQRWLSYEIMENNMGFKMYRSTFKVMPLEGGDEKGCEIKWLFVAEPVDGWKFEDLVCYLESSVQAMGQRLENALQSTN